MRRQQEGKGRKKRNEGKGEITNMQMTKNNTNDFLLTQQNLRKRMNIRSNFPHKSSKIDRSGIMTPMV